MKLIRYLSENILFVFTLFLLSFIPLYPKIPLIDIKNTWVYVRLDDFMVALSVGLFGLLWIFRKVTIKTPITIPVLIFWTVGLVSTALGIVFIFPHLQDAPTNVAILSYLRRIEYLSVIFVAYSALRHPKTVTFTLGKTAKTVSIGIFAVLTAVFGLLILDNTLLTQFPYFTTNLWIAIVVAGFSLSLTILSMLVFSKKESSLVLTLLISLLVVVAYGLGQKYYGLPAYLTMNEEFAKGIPLRLSPLARIPSTFAGHYDLAAYLVLVIAIMGSMIFAFKKWYMKILFFLGLISGLVLLLMTASRVSFAVYLLSISFLLVLHKKKILIIPVIILSILFSTFFQGITQRFSSTISQVDLVVDARTGKAVGIAKEGSDSLVIEDTQSTGENLPKGTAYIKLPAKDVGAASKVTLKRTQIKAGTTSAQITNVKGNFVVQKVLAYDVSFTTRFQGEWPRAMEAFGRDVLLGSGYSAISLATDNNYLRILGEIGLLGFLSFLSIFLVAAIYLKRVLPHIDSPIMKGFIFGTMAGIFGLMLNAVLIDVFEASKVAYVLWLLVGASLGVVKMYEKEKINYYKDIKTVVTSIPAILAYLLVIAFTIFWASFNNFFMGDDFTWLRWAADCKKIIPGNTLSNCVSTGTTIKDYFLHADGFFYRPGTKVYFLFTYAVFGLNAMAYHVMSVIFHLITAILGFFIALKWLKNKFFAFLVGAVFLVLSSHAESVYWVAATGHIIAAAMVLFSLLMYMYYKDTKNWILLVLSLLGAAAGYLFHEFGIVTPVVIIAYDVLMDRADVVRHVRRYWYYLLYIATIPAYLLLRGIAQSHWFNGDYSYKVSNLPFNIFGNLLGYIALGLVGSPILPYYEQARDYGKTHVGIVAIVIVIVLALLVALYMAVLRKVKYAKWQVMLFGFGFFVITLLTFLGLGNITTRYVYLPSFGLVLLLVYLLQLSYEKFEKMQKYVGLTFVIIVVCLFSYYQYTQLQRINDDWNRAGTITDTLLKNFNDVFQVGKTTPVNPVFYFVNVPIKTGEAWIFPVGLDDAMWFTFQNENLTVKTEPTLDMALDQAVGSSSARVFEFDKNGNVEEVDRSSE